MFNNKIKVALSFAAIAVVLVWLVFTGFNENMQYYVSIDSVKSLGESAYNKGLRVKGYLVAGSLVKSQNSLEVSFVIEDEGHELEVHYAKELPDTFKDGAEVLVEGRYTRAGYFDANVLMAKCPSKYESGEDYNTGYEKTEIDVHDGTN